MKSSERLVQQSVGLQAQLISQNALKEINLTSYTTITPESGENAYYKELRTKLNQIREANGLKYLYTMAKKEVNGEAEYVYIVDGMPLDSKADDFSGLGQVDPNPSELLINAFAKNQIQIGDLYQDETYGALLSAYVPIKSPSGEILGILGADFDASSIYELMQQNRSRAVWIILLFIVCTSALTYLFSLYISRPIKRLTSTIKKVSSGDLTLQIEVKQKDEIGQLSASFGQMITDLHGMIRVIRYTSEDIQKVSKQIGISTDSVSNASVRISEHMKETAAQAELQVLGGIEMDRSLKEVGSGIQRIAQSTGIVAESYHITTLAAQEGAEYIEQIIRQMDAIIEYSTNTSNKVKTLTTRTDEVRKMVDIIRQIAEQTNLLALNAAIEAARAGEQGRGFTVVADQIRKLSVASQESVNTISEVANEIEKDTEIVILAMEQERMEVGQGVSIVRNTRESFHRILNEVTKVGEQAQEVSAVSEEVAAGSEQVEASAGEFALIAAQTTERVQEVSKSAEEQALDMKGVSEYVESLEKMSGELNHLIERFKV
ncbi:methyl-accepting chemotaxis protein [Paenibacillus wynnii]|uniref:methyl-accepting chemotaxis protein n=1 Tax=Paenibacillus wynnii TaxID=268407 RepID=UPI00278CEFE7|nr:methyl-accepting chemotaxis protein [Paenibacillus wynnii]MDQ0192141.1 methyl-accepting chemotaxis protein [Paenibacillus wynnii]